MVKLNPESKIPVKVRAALEKDFGYWTKSSNRLRYGIPYSNGNTVIIVLDFNKLLDLSRNYRMVR